MHSAAAFPEFFDAAPRIRLRDPLADFLGASADGILEYEYADVVKLAGHSCPTVASAYLMARAALYALFPGTLPERGAVRVAMPQPVHEGVSGVMGNVMSFVTGAAGDGGFHGIASRFDRRDLLSYGAEDLAGRVRFTRTDTGAAVGVQARPERIPGDPRIRTLIPRCLTGAATPAEADLFRTLWQDRVRRLLVEHADDPEVIAVTAQP
jgi:hypothetical protein